MQDDPHTARADGIESDEPQTAAERSTAPGERDRPAAGERQGDEDRPTAGDGSADEDRPTAGDESRADDHDPPPGSDGHASSPESDDDDRDRAETDSEPLAYRLERLRLWRTLVTLAVVVGRLIRSL
ncbi:hypothetical protein C461_12778 [Halorubrum aidingense JCM 13560]|uniref:Uncharacterized protein n=1 Tax=Halorubrum aidingense JCM 13560 TaxID=1230454 RepID=M0P928_9EURY|nr:hypothetical protein [Halorubrum aidingense]EMA66049.1 hypothetical protein C461_12778 [Halorubrum aidingense JCM 13560]